VHDAGTVVEQRVDLAVVDMHTVCGHDPGLEQALLLQVGHDRHLVLVAAGVHLVAGLGNVDLQGHLVRQGQLGRRPEDLLGAGVGCVGRHRRDDGRMVLPPLDEGLGSCEGLLEGVCVRGREAEHGLTQDGAQAGLGGGLGDVVLEVVHVREAGHP